MKSKSTLVLPAVSKLREKQTANIGVHFEFLMLGSVNVKCSEVFRTSEVKCSEVFRRGKLGRLFVCLFLMRCLIKGSSVKSVKTNYGNKHIGSLRVHALFWGALCPSKSGLMNKHISRDIP
jgi:hypothetical protein